MPTPTAQYEEIRQQLENLQKDLPRISAGGATSATDPNAIANNIEQINKKIAPFAQAIKAGSATFSPDQQQQLSNTIDAVISGMKQIDQAPSEIRLALKSQCDKLRSTLEQITPAIQSGARATKR